MHVPNLRSPHDKILGLVYFGRMLDKIRLHAAGRLPEDFVANLGEAFDRSCVEFLKVGYPDLVAKVNAGLSDEAALEWCFAQGHRPSDGEILIWNEYMRKRGWNDQGSARLNQRKAESGFTKRDEIQTFFDYIDADEGRPFRGQP